MANGALFFTAFEYLPEALPISTIVVARTVPFHPLSPDSTDVFARRA